MKKRIHFLWAVLLLLAASCTDRDDELVAVNIRVYNESNVVFDKVQVGTNEEILENIEPEQYSDYLEFETAYRYAYIEITSGENVYILQPIDYVGESTLPSGFYTYALNVGEGGDVQLDFRVDY